MTEGDAGVEVILPAAGLSRRMGGSNKLLMPFRGRPLVRHVAEQVIEAGAGAATVVTGCESTAVEAALAGLSLSCLFNPDFEAGQMSSVRLGVREVSGRAAGVMAALADMPYLTPHDYDAVVAAFFRRDARFIVVPYYAGARGNPIVIPARFSRDIVDGSLNAGCKRLVDSRPDDVWKPTVSSKAHVMDIDTPADYRRSVRKDSAAPQSGPSLAI